MTSRCTADHGLSRGTSRTSCRRSCRASSRTFWHLMSRFLSRLMSHSCRRNCCHHHHGCDMTCDMTSWSDNRSPRLGRSGGAVDVEPITLSRFRVGVVSGWEPRPGAPRAGRRRDPRGANETDPLTSRVNNSARGDLLRPMSDMSVQRSSRAEKLAAARGAPGRERSDRRRRDRADVQPERQHVGRQGGRTGRVRRHPAHVVPTAQHLVLDRVRSPRARCRRRRPVRPRRP